MSNETGSNLASGGLATDAPQWFCVRARPKHEHIAAAHIALVPQAEVFLPRIRFQRPTKHGKMWVVEALFPNYLFARFVLRQHLSQVRYASGVQGVVHFGTLIPVIPDAVVAELRAQLGTEALCVVAPEFQVGESVKIIEGSFAGLQAVVTRLMPGRERAGVLLEFLGRQVMVEVQTAALLRACPPRECLLTAPPSEA